MARDYRAEYRARKERAREKGFSGYGQQRRFQDRQLRDIMSNDPIFGGLPESQRTRANAILYRQGWLYTGHGTPSQSKARKKLLKVTEGNFDIGVWTDYYKDVIYPSLTGHAYAGWTPTTVSRVPMTPDDWEQVMRTVNEQELEE